MDSKKSGLFCVVRATVSVTMELKRVLLPWDCSRWREKEMVYGGLAIAAVRPSGV